MGYKEVVKKVWHIKNRHQDPWVVLKEKIKNSQQALSKWTKENSSQTEILFRQKTNQLVVLQGEEEQIDMGKINSLQQEINELLEINELKWSQQAKENWLKHGDKNSKYFQACVRQRRRTNQITEIRDVEGIY
jgi:hypothetical protein